MAMTKMRSKLLLISTLLFSVLSSGFALDVNWILAPDMNETLEFPFVALSALASNATSDAVDTIYIDFNRDLVLASYYADSFDPHTYWDNSTYKNHGANLSGSVDYYTGGPSGAYLVFDDGSLLYNATYDLQYDWTVSFWFGMFENLDGVLIDNTEVSGPTTYGWQVYVDYLSGTLFNLVFRYWDINNVMQTVTVPFIKNSAHFYSFTMDGGTYMRGYKDTVLVDQNPSNLYAISTEQISVGAPLTNSSQVLNGTGFTQFTIFKRELNIAQLLALRGNFQLDVSMTEYNLAQNSTYEAWVWAKDSAGLWDWEYDYVQFFTGDFGDPPPGNQAPVVILTGTQTGWTTCDSVDPAINVFISDDSSPPYDCTLFIDGAERGNNLLNQTQGAVSWVGTLLGGNHLIHMECSDQYGAVGTSLYYELQVDDCYTDIPFEICAYDNVTLDALDAVVIAYDESDRNLISTTFFECYETVIPLAYGDYFTVAVASAGYSPFFEVQTPIEEYNGTAYLTTQVGVSGQVETINLTSICEDLRVNEPHSFETQRRDCLIITLRCNEPLYPYSCDILGFTPLENVGDFDIKITDAGYFDDYIVIQSTCDLPIQCFHIIEAQNEVPGIFVNLAKNPAQGAFMVLILLLGGFLIWQIG